MTGPKCFILTSWKSGAGTHRECWRGRNMKKTWNVQQWPHKTFVFSFLSSIYTLYNCIRHPPRQTLQAGKAAVVDQLAVLGGYWYLNSRCLAAQQIDWLGTDATDFVCCRQCQLKSTPPPLTTLPSPSLSNSQALSQLTAALGECENETPIVALIAASLLLMLPTSALEVSWFSLKGKGWVGRCLEAWAV